MKHTKKIVAFLLALFLASTLTACKLEPKSTHLDWIFTPSPPYTGALTENGYYYYSDAFLHYTDIATGASVVLCQKPGCKHVPLTLDMEEAGLEPCDAELDLSAQHMLFENDRLYYTDNQNLLWSRNATGGELRKLGTLAKELVEDRKSADVRISAICNGYLYYFADVFEIKTSGDGISSSSGTHTGYCIGRFDLTQRRDEILVYQQISNYNENIELVAARETGILYLYFEGLDPKQDWEDWQKRLEALKTMPVQVKHLDLTTSETTVLLSTVYEQTRSVITVENGAVLYQKAVDDAYEMHNYNLTTGKNTVVHKGDTPFGYYGKGYCLQTKWLDAKTAEYRFFDMNSGKTLPFELSGHFATMSRSAHGMVMYYNNHSTLDGYYFLSYDSLTDGLQEADLILLYNVASIDQTTSGMTDG